MAQPKYTVRHISQADLDLLPRMARKWTGGRPTKQAIVKAATLFGRVGRVVQVGNNKEDVVGFVLATTDRPAFRISWLAADPNHLMPVLDLVLESLFNDFPDFEFVVRVPNNEGKYSFLSALRESTGMNVLADPSRPEKVTDESEDASHVYVLLRGDKQQPAHGRDDGPPSVVSYFGLGARS